MSELSASIASASSVSSALEYEERIRTVLRDLRQKNVSLEQDILQLEKALARRAPVENASTCTRDDFPLPADQDRGKSRHCDKVKDSMIQRIESCRQVIEPSVRAMMLGRRRSKNLLADRRLIFAVVDVSIIHPQLFFCKNSTGDDSKEVTIIVVGPRNLRKLTNGALRIADQLISLDSRLVADIIRARDHESTVTESNQHGGRSNEENDIKLEESRTSGFSRHRFSAADFFSAYLSRYSTEVSDSTIVFGVLRQTVNLMATLGTNIEVEIIRFSNESNTSGGLGFGIVGGPSTGVVVKTILPASAAFKDNRLRAGDRILQVGRVNVQGMSSQQVAALLRQSASGCVELVVGRPVGSSFTVDPNANIDASRRQLCWTMETKRALCPLSLEDEVQHRLDTTKPISDHTVIEETLQQTNSLVQPLANGVLADESSDGQPKSSAAANKYDVARFADGATPTAGTSANGSVQRCVKRTSIHSSRHTTTNGGANGNGCRRRRTSNPASSVKNSSDVHMSSREFCELALTTFCRENWLQDKHSYIDVGLKRDRNLGLGISIAGYCCGGDKSEEVNGIFIRAIAPNSEAYRSEKILKNDLVIAVNEHSLEHLSHADATEMLIHSGENVRLRLVRFDDDTPQMACLRTLTRRDSTMEKEKKDLLDLLNKRKAYWSERLGSDYDIIGVQLEPDSKVDGGLGISLEGTVDVVDGIQLCPHHFIESLQYDGPARKAGALNAGDELLQVNDRILYGESHVTIIQALGRAIEETKRPGGPSSVQLFCCRKTQPAGVYGRNAEQNLPLSYSLLATMHDDHIVKAKSETTLFTLTRIDGDLDEWAEGSRSSNATLNDFDYDGEATTTGSPSRSPSASRHASTNRRTSSVRRPRRRTADLLREASQKLRCRSLEQLSSLAVWHCVPIVVTLEKDSRGLGFSVVNYQDPLHLSESVIVVRSLVPGGVAQADGRIVPGDRLLFVNSEDLSHASLDRAVAALKSAPLGLVRLGITKPVPANQVLLGEHKPLISRSERLLAKGSSPSRRSRRRALQPRATFASAGTLHSAGVEEYRVSGVPSAGDSAAAATAIDEYLRSHSPFYRDRGRSLRSISHSSQEEIWIGSENYRRLNPQLYFASSSGSVSPASFRSGAVGSTSMLTWSPCSSRSLSPAYSPRASDSLKGSWSYDVVHLPTHLERTIKIFKSSQPLGIVVDADADRSLNGCVVRSICSKKAVARDGRILVGDHIVKINSESLRNVTNAQARAVLKRTNLIGTQCSVTYITSGDARVWKERIGREGDRVDCNTILAGTSRTGAVNTEDGSGQAADAFSQLSPKVFPKFYRSTVLDEDSAKNEYNAAHVDLLSRNLHVQTVIEFCDEIASKVVSDAFDEIVPSGELPYVEVSTVTSASKEQQSRLDGNEVAEQQEHQTVANAKSAAPPSQTDSRSKKGQVEGEMTGVKTGPLRSSLKGSRKKSEDVADVPAKATKFKDDNLLNDVEVPRLPTVENAVCSHSAQNANEGADAPPGGRQIWGDICTVVLNRAPNETFGISIVGGRVEVNQRGSLPGLPANIITGIFIKSVVPDSPAGRSGQLTMGNRVLSVNDIDLRNATHEFAVHTIKNATNPVKFVVQALKNFVPSQPVLPSSSTPEAARRKVDSVNSSAVSADGVNLTSNGGYTSHLNAVARRPADRHEPEPESAAALEKAVGDPENEDRYFYTQDKIQRKYGSLPGKPILYPLDNIPPSGLGFSLKNGLREKSPDGSAPPPVIVVNVTTPSVLPIQDGDELLEINGKVLFGLPYTEATEKIRDCCRGDSLAVLILRGAEILSVDQSTELNNNVIAKETTLSSKTQHATVTAGPADGTETPALDDGRKKSWQGKQSPTQQSSHASTPPIQSAAQMTGERTAEIESGREMWIEIDKNGKGLGLSIVGGSDTVLGSIVIHEVYSDGAAFHDGRLKAGDQVLEVNNTSLRDITHEQAISLLRRTPAKVRLLVYRDDSLRSSLTDLKRLYDFHTVELTKKPGRGLGISIIGRKHEPGVYISEIVKGGVADMNGLVTPGDQILEVNGHKVQDAMQEDVATILKTCTGRVVLKIGRWKTIETTSQVYAAQPPSLAQHQSQLPLQQQQNLDQPTDNGINNNNNTISQNGGENRAKIPPPPAPMPSTTGAVPSQPPTITVASGKSVPPLQITVHDENQQQQVIRTDLSPVSEEDLKSLPETTASEETHISSHSHTSSQARHSIGHHYAVHNYGGKPGASSSSSSSGATINPLASATRLRTDLIEEDTEQLLIRLRKDDGNQWGMGIGKRQRGILITSLQPGSTAAEKLAVGDRIMAVNGREVTDQLSAVTLVRESGNDVALQIGRPKSHRIAC